MNKEIPIISYNAKEAFTIIQYDLILRKMKYFKMRYSFVNNFKIIISDIFQNTIIDNRCLQFLYVITKFSLVIFFKLFVKL